MLQRYNIADTSASNRPSLCVAKRQPRLREGTFSVPNALFEGVAPLDTLTERLLFCVLAHASEGVTTVPAKLVNNHYRRVKTALRTLEGFTVQGRELFSSIEWSRGGRLSWEFTKEGTELLRQRGCFTLIRWDEYIKLRLKRARLLYFFLSQFSSTGVVFAPLHGWQTRLGAVASTYKKRPSQFIRCVLGPALAAVKLNTRFKCIKQAREGQMLTLRFTQVLQVPSKQAAVARKACTCPPGGQPCLCGQRKRAYANLRKLGVTGDMAELMAWRTATQDFKNIQRVTYRVAHDEVLKGKSQLPIINKGAYLIRVGQNILFGVLKRGRSRTPPLIPF